VKKIDRYIFRQLITTTLFVAITLTGVVWLTQSLRFVEMIVNRGLSASLFLYFTMLLLPGFLGIILPVALFVAVIFIYNRLLVDSELVVLRAGGYSQYALARPAMALALVVVLACYAIAFYFSPASYREFKDLQFTLRSAYPTVLLQEGVFSQVMKGVTIYVQSRDSDGELSGIIVHDARVRNQPVTMMAERGSIVAGNAGARVVLVTGSRQQVDEKDGSLSLLYFDRYSFDLSTVNKSVRDRWREPRERYMHELFFSEDGMGKIYNFHKLRMEGHHRLSMPLLPLSFTLVGLAFLLAGDFNRRGQLFRILGAVSTVIVIEIAQLGVKNLGEKTENLTVLIYVAPLLPALLAAWWLNNRGPVKKRPLLPVPDQG
jgi:lipopolysaccharide export system permease protein